MQAKGRNRFGRPYRFDLDAKSLKLISAKLETGE